MTATNLLWPEYSAPDDYSVPDDLATIESVPLSERGLPEDGSVVVVVHAGPRVDADEGGGS